MRLCLCSRQHRHPFFCSTHWAIEIRLGRDMCFCGCSFFSHSLQTNQNVSKYIPKQLLGAIIDKKCVQPHRPHWNAHMKTQSTARNERSDVIIITRVYCFAWATVERDKKCARDLLAIIGSRIRGAQCAHFINAHIPTIASRNVHCMNCFANGVKHTQNTHDGRPAKLLWCTILRTIPTNWTQTEQKSLLRFDAFPIHTYSVQYPKLRDFIHSHHTLFRKLCEHLSLLS